ncbi:aminoacid decarboxylase [Streptomyces sp. NPDC100445]|uniref:Orn/Lys/Arg family decarboxylase n=1 Tax=Streptomyces sp. NPDC100445 TaxID=3366102 RepID=UPI0038033D5C
MDLLGTTSSSSRVYATLDGWRRHMVQHGHGLLDAALHRAGRIRKAVTGLPGLRLMGEEVVDQGLTAELDLLKITIDVRDLGISGMQAAEWLRAHCHVDVGSSDTCRISGQITHADDDRTENLLIDSLHRLVEHAGTIEKRPPVHLPEPRALQLEQAMLPRDAYFATAEHVPAERAVGRVAAETISPYPPGVPVVAPGEVITPAVIDYLRGGAEAGMLLPDAADPTAKTFRVTAR